MCLLDQVLTWDDDHVVCLTQTHRDARNPLRSDGQLAAVHVFEYAAQATAIHGGLRARAAGGAAPPGYLAALRDAHLQVQRLDDIREPLEIRGKRLFGDDANTVYECTVLAGAKPIADARVTIMLRG